MEYLKTNDYIHAKCTGAAARSFRYFPKGYASASALIWLQVLPQILTGTIESSNTFSFYISIQRCMVSNVFAIFLLVGTRKSVCIKLSLSIL